MNDTILGIQDEKSARAVRRMFNGFGLPVPGNRPEGKEYRNRTWGMGPLVFVSRYSFVIRIVPEDKIADVENPHFIRPLFNRVAGNHRFVIDPGYELGSADDDRCKNLRNFLSKKHGLLCQDMHPANIANVPGYPDHLVLIDMEKYCIVSQFSIARLTSTTKAIAARLGIRGISEPDPQIALYKPLRDILEQAWPEDAPVPDPEGIHAFKELCLTFKAEGKLRADWEDPQHDYRGTWNIARLYDDHLKYYETYCDRHQNPQPLCLPV